jgi:hypothetical protein
MLPAEPFYCVTCFFIDKSGEVWWVSHPAVEGRKLLRWRTTKAEGRPFKAEAVIKRQRTFTLDPVRVSCCACAQSAHAPTRYQNSSAYDGLQIGLSTEHLDRRIATKRTHLRYQVLVSICANSACASGLRDLLLSEFPVKKNGRKITSQFLFRPPPV